MRKFYHLQLRSGGSPEYDVNVSNAVGLEPDLWRTAMESTALAVIIADTTGQIVRCNEAANHILGTNAAGNYLTEYFPEFSSDTRRAGQAFPFAEMAVRKGADPLSVEGTVAVGDSGCVLTFSEGAERQRLKQAADRASKELQEFAYIVSHDLNAPLRSVKAFVDLLQRRCARVLDQDAVDYLGFITTGAKEMELMLNSVLAYSQAGRSDRTNPQDTDATGMLQWAQMNVDALVRQSGATIIADPLPHVWVDSSQLAQIFQHLLTNALKFRSAESPRIHVSALENGDGMVEFAVSDNGTGIEPEQLQRVFGVFRRLVGKEIPGTGIGLPICRKIVEAHNGRMWAESEPGKGSTFRFTLPVA